MFRRIREGEAIREATGGPAAGGETTGGDSVLNLIAEVIDYVCK